MQLMILNIDYFDYSVNQLVEIVTQGPYSLEVEEEIQADIVPMLQMVLYQMEYSENDEIFEEYLESWRETLSSLLQ